MGQYDTRATLLIRVRDAGDRSAWGQFVEIYTPMLHAYCMRRGLQSADAADVVQDTMRAVARAIAAFEYDPERGTFRSWLYTVARNKLNNHFAKAAREPGVARDGLEALPEVGEEDRDAWELEYRRQMFHWAAAKVRGQFRAETWDAFWRTAVDDEPVDSVAEALGMKRGAIYVARSRVIARLRETIEQVAGEGDVMMLGAG